MDFKKRLKQRLYFAIGYIILGLGLIVTFSIIKTNNNFYTGCGFALIIIGIARIRNHFLITKNEETIKKQMILETDERNIAIANKAKSLSFMVYTMFACIAVIILEILNKVELAIILSATVCALILIYWIIYFIIRKKS